MDGGGSQKGINNIFIMRFCDLLKRGGALPDLRIQVFPALSIKEAIIQPTEFWEQDVIVGNIRSNDQITFYTQHGDYIARTASWLAVLVFLAAVVKRRVIR